MGAEKNHPEDVEQYRVNLGFSASSIQLVSVRGMKCRIAEHLRRRKQSLEILVDWEKQGYHHAVIAAPPRQGLVLS